MTTRRDLLILCALVLLLRLPFLNQAIQGDDVYYLAAAEHAQIDPLHPNHTWYIFEGNDVTFQGYPHPPLNAWFLAVLLALCKDVREIPFHAAYILFSLMAAAAMYALARRFSSCPLWATALFLAVPAFVVNGNSFESDVPLLAFWMAGAALFIYGVDRSSRTLLGLAALSLALAALVAMQSLLFTPILLAYLWFSRDRRTFSRGLIALTPVLTLIAWQLFERVTSGVFPAAVSAGYQSTYGFLALALKVRSAAALAIHALFIVPPILLPFLVVRRDWKESDTRFLAAWAGIFLAGAMLLFFAGSARYLLPMAAPVALLASRAPVRWLRAAFIIQIAVSLCLAIVNYQHWNAYRTFAASLRPQKQQKRVWVNAEWGLRYYLEADGARPVHRQQWIPTGDIVVESELAFPVQYDHAGRLLVPIATQEIRPWLPFRLIGLDSQSGYSTATAGFLPYDFRGGVIDRVHAFVLERHEPVLTNLSMADPQVDPQILSGIFPREGQPWRWIGAQATVLLKSPGRPGTLQAKIYIPDASPTRNVALAVENGPSTSRTFSGPGNYTLSLSVDASRLSVLTVALSATPTFSPPGDDRVLSVILTEVGFAP